MFNIETLEKEYNNSNLEDYLKRCSIDNLEKLLILILCEKTNKTRQKIYDMILEEIEYRKISSSSLITNDKLNIMIELYYNCYRLSICNYCFSIIFLKEIKISKNFQKLLDQNVIIKDNI